MSEALATESGNTNDAAQTTTASTSTEANTQVAATNEAGATTQQPVGTLLNEGTKTEVDKNESEASKPEGAPDKYEFAAPEGKDFDADVLAKFSEVAKDLNMSQANAQKVLDGLGPALAAKQERMLAQASETWANETKADKEIGGDMLKEKLAIANKTLDTFGTPALRALLEQSGLGNNKDILSLLVKAGKAISEDSFVGSGGGKSQQAEGAKALYPNSKLN